MVEICNFHSSVQSGVVVQELCKFNGACSVGRFAGHLNELDNFFVHGLLSGNNFVGCEFIVQIVEKNLDEKCLAFDPFIMIRMHGLIG